ncbi:MAG: glycoside hydrolase family 3 N-terminal domain-containing protein [Christensenellales bacterium]
MDGCAKHFPGHGGTNVDTHKSLPTITLSMEELEAGPLVPFYAAIEAGVKSIMTTHIMFPALDKESPGTLSGAVLSVLLRGKMRYGGIIITDCLEMGAIASRYGAAEAALLAAKAGADMPLISHSHNEAARAAELISRAIERER